MSVNPITLEHHLVADSTFEDQFDEATRLGGDIHLPAVEWIPVRRPLGAAVPGRPKKPVTLWPHGATLRQDFDTFTNPNDTETRQAILTLPHEQSRWWGGGFAIATELTVWGQGDTSAIGIDAPNSNHNLLHIRGRRLHSTLRLRTAGPDGQCETNIIPTIFWSECAAGIIWSPNPQKPSGGHSGQRIGTAVGHSTWFHLLAEDGANLYGTHIDGLRLWHNRRIPWSIGFFCDGNIPGLRMTGQMEVAWKDRHVTQMAPVALGPNATGVPDATIDMHLTNRPGFTGAAVIDQRDQAAKAADSDSTLDTWGPGYFGFTHTPRSH